MKKFITRLKIAIVKTLLDSIYKYREQSKPVTIETGVGMYYIVLSDATGIINDHPVKEKAEVKGELEVAWKKFATDNPDMIVLPEIPNQVDRL